MDTCPRSRIMTWYCPRTGKISKLKLPNCVQKSWKRISWRIVLLEVSSTSLAQSEWQIDFRSASRANHWLSGSVQLSLRSGLYKSPRRNIFHSNPCDNPYTVLGRQRPVLSVWWCIGYVLELAPVQNVRFWCEMIGHTFSIQHDFSDYTMQVVYNKICFIRKHKPCVTLEQSFFTL